ncbi:MAG: DUF2723 domain-containing protein [Chloroflexi bacterium]|nr:DUF2723 domain-containing protein [Chloroflexota bacterium]
MAGSELLTDPRSAAGAPAGGAATRAITSIGRVVGIGGPVGAAFVALWLARGTLLPGVAFWDTAEFQTVPPLLGTLHPTGFPAYAILGWVASIVLQPFGEPAFRMDLFAALCVAAAVGLTVVLVRQLTGRPFLAFAAGIVLFLTRITWDISSHADAHSLHLVLLALLLVLLVGWEERVRAAAGSHQAADRWLIAAAATYAVAVANHPLALLVAPGIALFVLAVEPGVLHRPRLVGSCIGVFGALVAALYLELPLRAGPFRAPLVYGHPETPAGFAYVVLAEQFRGALGTPLADLGRKLHDLIDLTTTQLGSLAPLVPLGLAATIVRRPRYALLTVPTLAITCFFAVSYRNADIDRYYLGPLLIAITWGAIAVAIAITGAAEAARAMLGRSGRSRATTAAVLGLVGELVGAGLFAVPAVTAAPAVSVLADRHLDTAAADWLDLVLAELKPNAVVISWWSYSTPLWYARDVEGRRPDITIIDDRTRLDENLGDVPTVIDSYLGRRPVYIIRLPAETAMLGRRYQLAMLPDPPRSGLAEVVGRRSTGF